MARKRSQLESPAESVATVKEPKVAMSYRLSPSRIARAQKILGTATATATIEEALDMVVLRHELVKGTDAAFGLEITEAFPDGAVRPRGKRR